LVIGLNSYIARINDTNFECFKDKILKIQDAPWFDEATPQGSSCARKRLKVFNEHASSYFKDCIESE